MQLAHYIVTEPSLHGSCKPDVLRYLLQLLMQGWLCVTMYAMVLAVLDSVLVCVLIQLPSLYIFPISMKSLFFIVITCFYTEELYILDTNSCMSAFLKSMLFFHKWLFSSFLAAKSVCFGLGNTRKLCSGLLKLALSPGQVVGIQLEPI